MKVKFQDEQFDFQLLRVMGHTSSRQAEPGECLATAGRIVEGDFESWTREWTRTASRCEEIAVTSLAKGRRASAGDAFLRAANYLRAAEFYLHGTPSDPRIAELSDRALRCFHEGLRASGVRHEVVRVAYEGTTLPAIFYPGGEGRRRTLIVQTGFDGTIDGLLPWAQAATARGWHCLTFEGPGQGEVIRKQGLPFRHDWEKVVGPVIDALLARPDVDPSKIAILGNSFGGWLAPRAAAFEPRIAACVANGGVLDFIGPRLPKGAARDQILATIDADPAAVDAQLRAVADASTEARWGQENGMYTFQAATPSAWLKKLLAYDLTNDAAKIRCPTLVVDVEHESSFPGEAKKLFELLTCDKTWCFFSDDEGAGDHCQVGNPALAQQRVFDWLEEKLG